MKSFKTYSPYLFLFLSLCIACATQKSTSTTHTTDEAPTDKFDQLRTWIGDAKIVALGESSHGIGEIFTLKAELVEWLHREMDFDVLMMESGIVDIALSTSKLSDIDAKTLRDETLFANFQCAEILPLFEHIMQVSKTENPLHYAGYDIQISSGTTYELLDSITTLLGCELSFSDAYRHYGLMFRNAYGQDSSIFLSHQDSFQVGIARIQQKIYAAKDQVASSYNLHPEIVEIITHNLAGLLESVDFYFEERLNAEYVYKSIELRDELMYQNIEWLLENYYPKKKIIIWAHNSHVENANTAGRLTQWMGHHLKRKYQEDYFSIGIFARQGESYQHWTRDTISFDNSSEVNIEQLMYIDDETVSYQILDDCTPTWLCDTVAAFEVENTGNVNFVARDRFDAAIMIPRGSIPTYRNN